MSARSFLSQFSQPDESANLGANPFVTTAADGRASDERPNTPQKGPGGQRYGYEVKL